ncbi:hypothetical protein SRHO_G00130960 [Serrasalmus rhombeus]
MPFGLMNTQANFQQHINSFPREAIDHCMFVYLDDTSQKYYGQIREHQNPVELLREQDAATTPLVFPDFYIYCFS